MRPLLLTGIAAALTLLLPACADERDFAGPAAVAHAELLGEYRWVRSSLGTGDGASHVETPGTRDEQRALAVTPDSLVYAVEGARAWARAYRPLGEVSLGGYTGLALETYDIVDGQSRSATLATDLRPDGTLRVFPLDPACVEGCLDEYERVPR